MAKDKKKGFFSWLGFGRKDDKQSQDEELAQTQQAAEEETLAQQEKADEVVSAFDQQRQAEDAAVQAAADLAAERERRIDDEMRQAAESAAERQRQIDIATDKVLADEAERQRLAAEAEQQRLAAEEEARKLAEQQAAEEAERQRLAAEAEQQRLAAEDEARKLAELQAAEEAGRQRLAEEAEQQRLAAEAEARKLAEQQAAEEAERQRLAAEAEQQRLAAEEEARKLAEQQAAEEAERQRFAVEAEQQRLAAEEEARKLAEQQAAEEAERQRLAEEAEQERLAEEAQPQAKKEGFFARLKKGLLKTRQNLGSGFFGLFKGKKIDDDLFEELEEQLLIADVGVDTTRKIIDNLTAHASRKELKDAEALYGKLREEMSDILAKVDKPLVIEAKKPYVILMIGVNGVGKTTTIGKLARQYQSEGKSVMLAAGDTFRAAAVEQLQVWGERNNVPVVAQHTGADPASVIFDAIQSAQAKGVDVLIADTAGRLQNKAHLMEELKKIVRVMKKLDVEAPHEVMLTLDASTGQNAVSQAKLFNEAVGLTGITLTKLDGTAKGGVIFAIADQMSIPIRYIGVGEGIEDLRPFKADDFIEALFARED